MFARHECLVSDNGPQYASEAFAAFATEYGFHHITSSPHYAQTNGLSENAVGTLKSILKKSADPNLGLLAYRTAPLEHGYSPAQLLMSRHLRTTLPTIPDQLKPSVIDFQRFQEKDENIKFRQKRNFDSNHGAKELPHLDTGSQVWIPDLQTKGTVQGDAATRNYYVNTEKGTKVRRNRRHLNHLPNGRTSDVEADKEQSMQQPEENRDEAETAKGDTTQTKSGRVVKSPKRYLEEC